jgi:UDP-N-acetylglucosamine--N-acetylmuramyl-(pentapeptide) pyrophosphoryl-undecaprenol N-acetylglucosamine transferase
MMSNDTKTRAPVRICLAASGGGHLHEILDLRPFWEMYDVHFVTEPTPLARQLSMAHTVHLVPHFAFGQFRSQPARSATRTALRNLKATWRALAAEHPQLVISTGAGSVFFTVLLAKLRGAKFILIESIARFEAPSLFGRLTHWFADAVFVQSERLTSTWPDAEVFDPFIRWGPSELAKEDLGLITVGTVMPFDRLVAGVAAMSQNYGLPSRLIAQVGEGGAKPDGIDARESIDFDEMLSLLERANVVFCHGGAGSLVAALRAGCRIVAMPRRADLGEHYDNHQQEIVSAFAARGLIEVAQDAGELKDALARALARQPERASTEPSALIERLRSLTNQWFAATQDG